MQKVLLAGSTGYLGGFLLKELKSRGYWVRVLVRSEAQKQRLTPLADEVFVGQVTDVASLAGVANGMDLVFSSVGITRQRDNLTYQDVDYQGNKNLLDQALKSGVQSFLYVSVFNGQNMKELKIIEAKERFADTLIAAKLKHCIIRPSGFFGDLKEVLNMARKGRVFLFGDGGFRGNPVSGKDLAKVCVDSLAQGKADVDVGGPKVYSQNEMAVAAFKALGKPVKISYIPAWVVPLCLPLLRTFSSVKTYGPIEFFMTALTLDLVTDCYGEDLLEHFFEQEARTP